MRKLYLLIFVVLLIVSAGVAPTSSTNRWTKVKLLRTSKKPACPRHGGGHGRSSPRINGSRSFTTVWKKRWRQNSQPLISAMMNFVKPRWLRAGAFVFSALEIRSENPKRLACHSCVCRNLPGSRTEAGDSGTRPEWQAIFRPDF